MKKLLLVFGVLFSLSALADEPSGLYVSEGLLGYTLGYDYGLASIQERTEGSSETSLGYVLAGWLYIGGVFNYTMINEKQVDFFSQKTNHQETFQYYGPALGWMGENWMVIGQYYAFAERKDNVSGDGVTSFSLDNTGTGFGLNLGYRFNLGGFELGPVISYKLINYTNCRDPSTGATSSCSPAIKQSEVTPYATLFYNFK